MPVLELVFTAAAKLGELAWKAYQDRNADLIKLRAEAIGEVDALFASAVALRERVEADDRAAIAEASRG